MAAQKQDKAPVQSRLEDAVRETLRPHLAVGRKATTEMLDTLTEEIVLALRGRFSVIPRRKKPRKETQRALARRLPEPGVVFPYQRGGRHFLVRIVDDHTVVLEEGETAKNFTSLKAVATEILGYVPSVSGWTYFFGAMTYDEVSARYKR